MRYFVRNSNSINRVFSSNFQEASQGSLVSKFRSPKGT